MNPEPVFLIETLNTWSTVQVPPLLPEFHIMRMLGQHVEYGVIQAWVHQEKLAHVEHKISTSLPLPTCPEKLLRGEVILGPRWESYL